MNGHVALMAKCGTEFLVDVCDLDEVAELKWFISGRNKRSRGHIKVCGSHLLTPRKMISLHRLLVGALPGEVVDHINGDTLDNRRSNLRIATPGQNSANAKVKGGTSKFKGVTFRQRSKGSKKNYQARICRDYKTISLGWFESEQEAALAYNKKAIEYFGEFARLNELKG